MSHIYTLPEISPFIDPYEVLSVTMPDNKELAAMGVSLSILFPENSSGTASCRWDPKNGVEFNPSFKISGSGHNIYVLDFHMKSKEEVFVEFKEPRWSTTQSSALEIAEKADFFANIFGMEPIVPRHSEFIKSSTTIKEFIKGDSIDLKDKVIAKGYKGICDRMDAFAKKYNCVFGSNQSDFVQRWNRSFGTQYVLLNLKWRKK